MKLSKWQMKLPEAAKTAIMAVFPPQMAHIPSPMADIPAQMADSPAQMANLKARRWADFLVQIAQLTIENPCE